jgi:hypothetical protein
MTKFASVGLAAVLLAGSFAVPAFAAPEGFDADYYGYLLQGRGVNVADHNGQAEVYGAGKDTIRAVVELADGSTEFQYFNIDTLQPVAGAGSTRVLSELSVD